ncbi:class I SAM-dependent methyltransferase [Gordonia iterans]
MTRPHHAERFTAARWEEMWAGKTQPQTTLAHPYLASELAGLTRGTALDAGCGAGAEAVWLAERGWRVTGADVSPTALAIAASRARAAEVEVDWVEADLTTWAPERPADLVTTFYAHPDADQIEFYRRLAEWVTVGGTLLIVGHLHRHDDGAHAHRRAEPPEETTATADRITAQLPADRWRIEAAFEGSRTVPAGGGEERLLHDVVVRATRLAPR